MGGNRPRLRGFAVQTGVLPERFTCGGGWELEIQNQGLAGAVARQGGARPGGYA